MPATPEFERLRLALQDRLLYPQNILDLLEPQPKQTSAPAEHFAAVELSVKALVAGLRPCITDNEAKNIGLLVMGSLQGEDVVSTRWVAEPSSRVYRTEQGTTPEGPHSVFLDKIVESDALFRKLVCAVLLKNTEPDLTILQLIVMALIENGDVADETEIRVWIMDRIPFHGCRVELEVAIDIQKALTNFLEAPKQILHLRPVDPDLALRGQGPLYRQEQKGRVWELSPGGEHPILQVLYAEGYNMFWNFPRPFLTTQNMQPTALVCLRKLSGMPNEILVIVGSHAALSGQTIYPRIIQDPVGFFQIQEVIYADSTGIYARLPRGRRPGGRRERSIDLQLAFPYVALPKLHMYIREQFFRGNHFMLEDWFAATQSRTVYVSTPQDEMYDTYLPFEFITRLRDDERWFLRSLSIELDANALEVDDNRELLFNRTLAFKVCDFLLFLRMSRRLRYLTIHIFGVSEGILYNGDLPHHRTFRMLAQIRGLEEVHFTGLEAYPELKDELVRLMTSPPS